MVEWVFLVLRYQLTIRIRGLCILLLSPQQACNIAPRSKVGVDPQGRTVFGERLVVLVLRLQRVATNVMSRRVLRLKANRLVGRRHCLGILPAIIVDPGLHEVGVCCIPVRRRLVLRQCVQDHQCLSRVVLIGEQIQRRDEWIEYLAKQMKNRRLEQFIRSLNIATCSTAVDLHPVKPQSQPEPTVSDGELAGYGPTPLLCRKPRIAVTTLSIDMPTVGTTMSGTSPRKAISGPFGATTYATMAFMASRNRLAATSGA